MPGAALIGASMPIFFLERLVPGDNTFMKVWISQ